LAARYLTYALQRGLLKTKADLSGDVALSFCIHYSCRAVETPSIIEWSNLDKLFCIENLPEGYNNRAYSTVIDLAAHLIREAQNVQGIFSKFFAAPKLELRTNNINSSSAGLRFIENFPESNLLVLCLEILKQLTNSSQLHAHILYIRNMDKRTRRLLKDTILVSEMFVAYSHIVSVAATLLTYGWYNNDEVEDLQLGSRLLASHLDSDCREDRELATVLSARSCRIHRYCKLALLDAVRKLQNIGAVRSLRVFSWRTEQHADSHRSSLFLHTGGVRYLKRFCFGGKYFITLLVFLIVLC